MGICFIRGGPLEDVGGAMLSLWKQIFFFQQNPEQTIFFQSSKEQIFFFTQREKQTIYFTTHA